MEADVPDIGLDRFYLSFKETGFTSFLKESGKEFQASAAAFK